MVPGEIQQPVAINVIKPTSFATIHNRRIWPIKERAARVAAGEILARLGEKTAGRRCPETVDLFFLRYLRNDLGVHVRKLRSDGVGVRVRCHKNDYATCRGAV